MTHTNNKLTAAIGFAFLLFVAGTDFAFATGSVDLNNPAFAVVNNNPTSIPVGHAKFCQVHPAECTINARVIETEALTEKKWKQLLTVNADFNASIVPVTDAKLYQVDEYWTYPNGYGDCEDYALAKRRQLINIGWNPSTLMLTVVRQANGEGHAVLMVRTDRGDLVLDNQAGLIKLWNETPYRFLKRQSQFDAAMWVDILDNRTAIVASR